MNSIALEPRFLGYDSILLVLLSFCTILIASAFFFNRRIVYENFQSVFYSSTKGIKISTSDIFLFLGYFVVIYSIFQLLIFNSMIDAERFVFGKHLYLLFIFLLVPLLNFLFSSLFLPSKFNAKLIYLQTYLNFNNLKAIVFLIIAVFWTFNFRWNNYFIIILLTISLLFFIARIVISFVKIQSFHINWFYLILYLCTLEIIPYVLIAYNLGVLSEIL